jgi:hypothetical protein
MMNIFKGGLEEMKSVAVHEEVPKEEAAVKTFWSTEEVAWGPASAEANSRVICRDSTNECQNPVEEPAPLRRGKRNCTWN